MPGFGFQRKWPTLLFRFAFPFRSLCLLYRLRVLRGFVTAAVRNDISFAVRGTFSRNGNFLFWEILSTDIRWGNPSNPANARGMRKSRFSKQYQAVLDGLRQARRDAGLTQTDVARRFGAHASFVSKIESGERRLDVVELAAFCRVYRIKLADFVR